MISRTRVYMDVARVRDVVDRMLPLFRKNRLYVTSRPGADDPLHDGTGWMPEGVTEADYSVLNEPFRGTAIEELLDALPAPYGRVRLMLMPPKSCLSFHWDDTTRLHYAVTTTPACYMIHRNGESCDLYHVPADGYVYRMDTRLVHNAMNTSNEPRIHLVIANLAEPGAPAGKLVADRVHEIPIVP